jgi:pentatricopeptide repeat protein
MQGKGYHADVMRYDAVKLFDEMARAGVKPDEHVYSLTIGALCKLHDVDRAAQVLGEMMEAGLRPWDLTLTYNFVVAVLVKAGRMKEALKVKDQMLLVAGNKMDVVLATTLMHGYCLLSEVGKALDLFNEAVRDGATATNVTYAEVVM